VEFGKPIDYDDLVRVIEQSDSRIKTVMLSEPNYELRYNTYNDTVGDYINSYSIKNSESDNAIKLLAKMILSGNVQLYNFIKGVDFRFGQEDITKYSDVK
jgi:hypothetical protein